jgi:D-amino-acid dehydrogenase
VKTNRGPFAADEIVLASGAWSPLLARELGLKLSLQAGKGYRIDIHRPTPVRLPAILMEAKVAVTPMEGFTRLAGTMEFSGINHQIRRNRVAAIARLAETYYDGFEVQALEEEKAACGLRPVTPDGLPYIGRVSHWKNLSLATGHAMMGWSLGPVTGKLISEIISGRPTSLNLNPLHPERRF